MASAASASVAAFSAACRFVTASPRVTPRLHTGSVHSSRPVAATTANRVRCLVHSRPLTAAAATSACSSVIIARSLSSSSHSVQQLEASLLSQLPTSPSPASPLSSSLPVVRRLLDVYVAQHKYGAAERILWRLCDEQTRGGAAEERRRDEQTVDALRTMASILQVRRSAAASDSGTASVLTDLTDRYHTLTASVSSAVVDHPTTVSFVASLARAHVDEGDRDRAEHILRSALLFDEPDDALSAGDEVEGAEVSGGRRLRYATAYNFLGIASYQPPVHVHSEACAHGHGHGHEDEQLRQYDWSESAVRWKRALAYLTPFIARLSSAHTPASTTALFTPDSVSLHLLRMYAMTEDNMSQAQFTSGREEEAVATLKRSIDALSALLPPHHTELLRVRHQLIRLHLAANDVSQAQKECEPVLSLDHRLLSLELTGSLDDLADSFFRLRHYQYAARLFQQCIAVREAAAVVAAEVDDKGAAVSEASGSVGDLITASRYNDLAMCELKLNNHTAAEEHLRRAIAIKQRILGDNHWECAVSVHNLGAALMGQQRYEEAETELQRARQLYEQKYEKQQSSDRDRDSVQAIVSSHLGQCYALMERWSDSVSQYEQAVQTRQRAVGDHPSVAMDLTQLGGVLLQSGSYSEAVRTFERVKEMAERMYGSQHTNVAVALHWLSMAEGRAGRAQKAVEHASQAVLQGEGMRVEGAIQQATLDAMKKNLTEQIHAAGIAHEAGVEEERSAGSNTANQPRSR